VYTVHSPLLPEVRDVIKLKKGVFSPVAGKINDFYWEITRFWGKSNN